MPRARNIKPGFFKNEDLAECTPWARLCFAGLWCLADREGRLEDRPKRIKTELFPADTIDVEPLLQELVRWKFIVRYEIDGLHAIQILKFTEHQTPHYSEKQSVIKPHDFLESPPLSTPRGSGNTPGKESSLRGGRNPLNPDSLNPESLSPKPPRGSGTVPGFAEFWLAYPRKVGKADAEKAWAKQVIPFDVPPVMAGVERLSASIDRSREDWERFVPHASTWLSGRRWEDEIATEPPGHANRV